MLSFEKFITDKKYRFIRHIILQFLLVIFVFTDLITYDLTVINLSLKIMFTVLFYWITFSLVIYINYYLLIPQFLARKNALVYIFSIIILLLFLSVSLRLLNHFNNKIPFNMVGFSILVSAVSAWSFLIITSSSIYYFKRWIEVTRQYNLIKTETLNAELNWLKHQVNPHFLFNVLNNANIMINQDKSFSKQMLLQLDKLTAYQFGMENKNQTDLMSEIQFLKDYLELEKTRRDNFSYTITTKGNVEDISIPPLLFITFVENAAKHSYDADNHACVNLNFSCSEKLIFECTNTIPDEPIVQKHSGGLGLSNIQQRLELLYNNDYKLVIDSKGNIFTVILELNL